MMDSLSCQNSPVNELLQGLECIAHDTQNFWFSDIYSRLKFDPIHSHVPYL